MGEINLNGFIPLARIAIISLSEESLPKAITVPERIAMGNVYIKRKGIIYKKSLPTLNMLTPFVIIRSANFTRLPRSITKVSTDSEKINGPKNSLKI